MPKMLPLARAFVLGWELNLCFRLGQMGVLGIEIHISGLFLPNFVKYKTEQQYWTLFQNELLCFDDEHPRQRCFDYEHRRQRAFVPPSLQNGLQCLFH